MSYEVRIQDAAIVPIVGLPSVRLLWTDPPYGTGKVQEQGGNAFQDNADTRYVLKALGAWLPYMDPDGTVCVCCDYRLAPQLAVYMKACDWEYRGEVVWEFGLGRPRTSWWPVRHNNVLTFTRTETSGLFDKTAVPRVRRLGGNSKMYKGKLYTYPDDRPAGSVWDYTFSGTDTERVGYPNQKPLALIQPFVLAHTLPGDWVVDPFCGSGSTGHAALMHGRNFYGCDLNPEAVKVSLERLANVSMV